MPRVSKVDERLLPRQPDRDPAPPDVHARGDCVLIRTLHGEEEPPATQARPGATGATAGAQALCLHLILLPPRTRSMPHLHAGHETAVYLVSGQTELWYGPGLSTRPTVRAGDFLYIPPGTPHIAVNRADVTAIAVVPGTDPADRGEAVAIELPRHLAGLLSLPVAVRK